MNDNGFIRFNEIFDNEVQSLVRFAFFLFLFIQMNGLMSAVPHYLQLYRPLSSTISKMNELIDSYNDLQNFILSQDSCHIFESIGTVHLFFAGISCPMLIAYDNFKNNNFVNTTMQKSSSKYTLPIDSFFLSLCKCVLILFLRFFCRSIL